MRFCRPTQPENCKSLRARVVRKNRTTVEFPFMAKKNTPHFNDMMRARGGMGMTSPEQGGAPKSPPKPPKAPAAPRTGGAPVFRPPTPGGGF